MQRGTSFHATARRIRQARESRSSREQLQLIRQGGEEVLEALAHNPHLCSTAQDVLAREADERVALALVGQEYLSVTTQEVLLTMGVQVRKRLAMRTDLAAHVQEQLVVDTTHVVRRTMLHTSELSAVAQVALAKEGDRETVWDLIQSHVLCREAVSILAGHEDWTVRTWMAGQVNLDDAMQVELSYDKHSVVRMELFERAGLLVQEEMSFAFLREYFPEYCTKQMNLRGLDGTWESMGENWAGSLSELLEAMVILQSR